MTLEERTKDIIRSCEISGFNYDFILSHMKEAVAEAVKGKSRIEYERGYCDDHMCQGNCIIGVKE